MNRIMLLGLLVCISRVALCGVMGVMAETVARRAGSSSLRGLCRLCVVAYALVLVASFAPMDLAQTVVHRAVPLLFLVPNLFIWISMRPSGASMRGTRRRNDADGSADPISCEPMNKENKGQKKKRPSKMRPSNFRTRPRKRKQRSRIAEGPSSSPSSYSHCSRREASPGRRTRTAS